jgi:hypothetical protein
MPVWAIRSVGRPSAAPLLAIFLALAVNYAAQAQQSQGRIDLARLILMYMVPQGSNVITPWETGSLPGSPITWQHAGIKDCDKVIEADLGVVYCRSGNVVVTVSGKPTHSILGKVVEPGRWKVTLAGGHAGIIYVVIDSDVLSQELSSGMLRTSASKSGSTIQVRRIKLCGSLTDGFEQLSVTAPGKAEAFAREWWTCGSGGCNVIITFAPRKEDAGSLLGCGP